MSTPTSKDILKTLNEWLDDQIFMHNGLCKGTHNQLMEMDNEEPIAQAMISACERDIVLHRHMENAMRQVKDKIERLGKK